MRTRSLPILLAACLMLVLAAVAAPAAAADDAPQVAAAAPVALDAPAPAPEPAVECPAGPAVEPIFLAPPPPPTCEECTADCDAKELQCESHCHTRDCLMSCLLNWFKCTDKCPC